MSEDMGRARLVAIEICQLFEEILDRHGIDIPSEDRDSEMEGMSAEDIAEAGFAHLYGDEYYELEDAITGMVEKAMGKKTRPDVKVHEARIVSCDIEEEVER